MRMVVDGEGILTADGPKLVVAAVRYRPDDVVAVLDTGHAGATTRDVWADARVPPVPVVANLAEALRYEPDTYLVGLTPLESTITAEQRARVLAALHAGLDVVAGLHYLLGDDPEVAEAARRHGRRVRDLRKPADDVKEVGPGGLTHRPGSWTVLAVGSDCAVGKMTTMLELHRSAAGRGLSSRFVATGQTGILVSGDGVPADHLIADFLPTAIHRHVCAATAEHDLVLVEGQAALNHLSYSPVSLGLLHGAAPDALVLCHRARSTHLRHVPTERIPPLADVVTMNETAARWAGGPAARVVGVALHTGNLSPAEADKEIAQVAEETGLPTVDVWRSGADALLDAVLAGRPAS